MRYLQSDEVNIASVQFIKEKNYWMDKMSGDLVKSYFAYDYQGVAMNNQGKDIFRFKIPDILSFKLNKLSKGSNTNLHIILTACVALLLYKYTNNDDIIIGTPIYKQDVEGEFINTVLSIRSKLDDNASFKQLLVDTKKTMIEAHENQNYPIEKLFYQLEMSSTSNDFALFDTIVLLENIQYKKYIEHINYNTLFTFTRDCECIDANIEFSIDKYKRMTIERIAVNFRNILEYALENVDSKIVDIEMITKEERKQLLVDYNSTYVDYGEDITLLDLFDEQVRNIPDHTALIFKEKKLSYAELDQKSNMLAAVLKEKGVKSDCIVGIMIERSVEMCIGILAILKAGGAFLPIDYTYPDDRKAYMLENSGAAFLLTRSHMIKKELFSGVFIDIEDETINERGYVDFEKTISPENLAYVIYTSGTTGKPKGVMIKHKGIYNTISWRKSEYNLNHDDCVIQLFSFSFDGFLTSFFTPLVSGSKVVLMDDNQSKDPSAIKDCIALHKVTHFICVPTLYSAILDCLTCEEASSLRVVTLAGEKLNDNLVAKSKEKLANVEIANEYGPTECSVASTISRNIEQDCEITIGKPISNTQVYIVDKNSRLQPVGITGELCLWGKGLASGYINNPNLTNEKFIENPFIQGQKMYKTGDLASWRYDGTINFIGRTDHQVKIRGYRIELEEIERLLLKHESIKEAVVIAEEDEKCNTNLKAYLVLKNQITTTELRDYLSKELPEYMIPSYFISIEKLPLTPGGKVDREALSLFNDYIGSGIGYVPPEDEIEKQLTSIWEDVLGVSEIGTNDNFIASGGDSIKAIQILSKLNNYGLKVEMKDLFQHPTIRELKYYVKRTNVKIDQGMLTGEIKMTPIQRWFFDNVRTDIHYFNQSVMLYREEGFDKEHLNKVFQKLVEHHDMLRVVFRDNGTEMTQFIRGNNEKLFDFCVLDVSNDEDYKVTIKSKSDEIQRSFNLNTGPLMANVLFKTNEGDHLLIVIHHLVIDGVSWRILFEDLINGYNQASEKKDIKFKEKTHSYKVWSDYIYTYADSHELIREMSYWTEIENTEVKSLPKNNEAKSNKLKDGSVLSFSLPKEDTDLLLTQVNQAYNTDINDILLVALGLSVKEWTGQDKAAVCMEGHGREEIFADINVSRTIGWFTSEYPVILDMTKSDDLGYVIKSVKEGIRRIPNKGVGYNILKYITAPKNKNQMKFNLKPEIGFNYFGQFDSDINNELFTISRLSPGDSMSPDGQRFHALDISGIIIEGVLTINVNYNRYEYSEEKIGCYIEIYRRILKDIISYCVQKGIIEITPADLGDGDLSLEELEDISKLYENI